MNQGLSISTPQRARRAASPRAWTPSLPGCGHCREAVPRRHLHMRFATLICWLVTASLGAFMLRTWLARGGLDRERAKQGGLPPQLIFGHAAAALIGLLIWAAFLASGVRPLAWTAVSLLMVAVGLRPCHVT